MGMATSPPKEVTFITFFVPPFFFLLNHILKEKKGNAVPHAAGWHRAGRVPWPWLWIHHKGCYLAKSSIVNHCWSVRELWEEKRKTSDFPVGFSFCESTCRRCWAPTSSLKHLLKAMTRALLPTMAAREAHFSKPWLLCATHQLWQPHPKTGISQQAGMLTPSCCWAFFTCAVVATACFHPLTFLLAQSQGSGGDIVHWPAWLCCCLTPSTACAYCKWAQLGRKSHARAAVLTAYTSFFCSFSYTTLLQHIIERLEEGQALQQTWWQQPWEHTPPLPSTGTMFVFWLPCL